MDFAEIWHVVRDPLAKRFAKVDAHVQLHQEDTAAREHVCIPLPSSFRRCEKTWGRSTAFEDSPISDRTASEMVNWHTTLSYCMNGNQRWRPCNDDRLSPAGKRGVLFLSLLALCSFLWEVLVPLWWFAASQTVNFGCPLSRYLRGGRNEIATCSGITACRSSSDTIFFEIPARL